MTGDRALMRRSKRSAFLRRSYFAKTSSRPADDRQYRRSRREGDLHLERLWSQNITITTRLVDTVTTPMLLKTAQAGNIDPKRLITHRFRLRRNPPGL